MTGKQAKLIAQDEQLRKRLAKFLVLHCFRNSGLEDLHAGIVPCSKTGDCSDVKVVTPYGEIPWSRLSRFNDDEMKDLMIDVVNRTYSWLAVLFCDDRTAQRLIEALQSTDIQPRWNDPQYIP
jgi:hypothetical protein